MADLQTPGSSPLAGEEGALREAVGRQSDAVRLVIDPADYGYGNLPRYLGSIHSTVGLLLAFLGLPSLVFGLILVGTGQTDIPAQTSYAIALWGLVALPLGVSMRRKAPTMAILTVAGLWLAVAIVTIFYGDNFG
jgi:hypothetical protein